MVVLPVELNEFSLEVSADTGKDLAQIVDHLFREYTSAVFCHKDQVHVHLENAMPAGSNVVDIAHRPNYN